MKKQEYEGYLLVTTKNGNGEETIAYKNNIPCLGCFSLDDKNDSIEKMKIKIDNLKC